MMTRRVAVLFADLDGFTALTEAHGDGEAALAAIRLVELTHRSYDGQARLVKAMGDGVLVVFDRVDTAVAAALALSHAAAVEPRFLGLRLGLDVGRVVEHDGDYFGATVNVAARLVDQAESGQVLATGRVGRRLATHSEVEVVDLGSVALRHVRDPVDVVEIRRSRRTGERFVDPVCRMHVQEEAEETVVRNVDGRKLIFCSRSCEQLYDEHPDAYR